jgi:hypothetical protein
MYITFHPSSKIVYMSYLWMVHNGQTKCFPNWFNGCDNLYTIKKLNDYFHMLRAFKWHCDGGSHNCTQNTFFMMYMCAYVHGCICSTLDFYWTEYKMNSSNIWWIMINTKWGPKPNGNKYIYTKTYNLKICGCSCGWNTNQFMRIA